MDRRNEALAQLPEAGGERVVLGKVARGSDLAVVKVLAVELRRLRARRGPNNRLCPFGGSTGEDGADQSDEHRHRPRVVEGEAGGHPSWVHAVGDEAAACAPGQLTREQDVGELAGSVGAPARVVLICIGNILEVDDARLVRGAGGAHDAGRGRLGEQPPQLARQHEIGEVVQSERKLEAVGALLSVREHSARIVDEDVEPLVPRAEVGGDPLDLGDAGQVADEHLDAIVAAVLHELGPHPFGLLLRPADNRQRGTPPREGTARLLADPHGRARDQEDLARETLCHSLSPLAVGACCDVLRHP